MTDRERFLRTMRYEPVDRRPFTLPGPWPDTVARWEREGLPKGRDIHEFLGVSGLRVANVNPIAGIYPPFETRTVSEKDGVRISVDTYGRTVRTFMDHTSMPEWLEFPVKSGDDLRRVMDEHFDVDDLDARFDADWKDRMKRAAASDAVVLVDGGGYYWTLRSLAGVETASYLFYDAPALVEELFERYFTVVMEGLRRVTALIRVDTVGFGEDIAYKAGPLVSPAMFRALILPRYRAALECARSRGVATTWYDSDGDLRQLVPDYLSVGIDNLAPCEVAAGMDPVELRRTFGRALRLTGGVDKREIARGPEAVAAEIARKRPLIAEGGYVPGIDHSVSSDISFDNYRRYVEALVKAVERP